MKAVFSISVGPGWMKALCISGLLFCLSVNSFSVDSGLNSKYFSRDTIWISAEPDYPPHSFINKNGEPDGFAIELFKEAAKAAGLNVKIGIGIWNQIKNDLAQGKIDALPLVGRTPERELDFDFTTPYLSLHGAVFVRTGTNDIREVSDLKGRQVGVMRGDNAEEFVKRSAISDYVVSVNTFQEAFQMLALGEIDAVVTQRVTGIELLKKLRIRSVVPLEFQLPGFRQDFCFAVQEGNDSLLNRLDEGLSIFIAYVRYHDIKS